MTATSALIERLKSEAEDGTPPWYGVDIGVSRSLALEAASRLQSLQEENERLKSALEPFADQINEIGNGQGDWPNSRDVEIIVRYADLQRARSSLSLKKEGEEK